MSHTRAYHNCGVSTLFLFIFFFFNDTATTEIYTLSLHDALPISPPPGRLSVPRISPSACRRTAARSCSRRAPSRSEEHTSELQSQSNLVCRLLLEKKKNTNTQHAHISTNPYVVRHNAYAPCA